jgi:hypothetical protein
MKRFLSTTAAAGIMLATAASADATLITTNWSERLDYANGKGVMRLYVRKIDVTRTTWKAWVGLTNNSPMSVRISSRLEKPVPTLPFTYWAGPGVWWSSYEKATSWYAGSGTVLTHAARAKVSPAYTTGLAPRKSWFGTFSGSTAKLPRTRLLRIGFGVLDHAQPGVFDLNGRPLRREIVLSTTHQFRLPKARR